MSTKRSIVDGVLSQGEDERIAYTLTVTPVGSSPTNPAVVVKDVTAGGTDVTATVMPSGSPSVAGDVITLPLLRDLTRDIQYRVEIQYTITGNLFETYVIVNGVE